MLTRSRCGVKPRQIAIPADLVVSSTFNGINCLAEESQHLNVGCSTSSQPMTAVKTELAAALSITRRVRAHLAVLANRFFMYRQRRLPRRACTTTDHQRQRPDQGPPPAFWCIPAHQSEAVSTPIGHLGDHPAGDEEHAQLPH